MSCSAIPCDLACLCSGKQECNPRKLLTCTNKWGTHMRTQTDKCYYYSCPVIHSLLLFIPSYSRSQFFFPPIFHSLRIFPVLWNSSAGASSFTPPLHPLPSPPSQSFLAPPLLFFSFSAPLTLPSHPLILRQLILTLPVVAVTNCPVCDDRRNVLVIKT